MFAKLSQCSSCRAAYIPDRCSRLLWWWLKVPIIFLKNTSLIWKVTITMYCICNLRREYEQKLQGWDWQWVMLPPLLWNREGEGRRFALLGARISGFRLESAGHSGTVDSSWAHPVLAAGRALFSWQWFSAWAARWNYLGSLVLREIRSELQGLGDSARLPEELRTDSD